MKKNIKYGIIILLLIGCNADKESDKFSGKFNGYWAETSWQFKFYSNNKFNFKSEGHYGFVQSKGTYQRRKDSLFLMPIDLNLKKQGVINSLYLIDGDSCIIDVKLKQNYCTTQKK